MRKIKSFVSGLMVISVFFNMMTVFGATGSADYIMNDTYEAGTTPTIAVSGDFQASLTPKEGSAYIAEQSNAAVLTYYGGTNSVTANSSRLALDTSWYNGKVQVYEMDMFIPKNTNIVITLEDSWNNREGFMISNKGWIAPHYILDFEGADFNWWLNNTYTAASTAYPNQGKSDHVAQFSFGKWNKVTMISDIENKIYYLYLNKNLVGIMDSKAELSGEKDGLLSTNGLADGGVNSFMQIINRKAVSTSTSATDMAMLDVPLILDNIKIGNMESFTKVDTLPDNMAVSVEMLEDFEDDTYNIQVERKTPLTSGDEWGCLQPTRGWINIAKQSNAAIVSFENQSSALNRAIRFNRNMIGLPTDAWGTNATEVISFDIQLFRKASLALSVKNQNYQHMYNVIISNKGYATHIKDVGNDDAIFPKVREIVALDKGDAANTYDVVDFAPYVWHNVKILYTAEAVTSIAGNNAKNACRLFIDNNYVGELMMPSWNNFQYIDITSLSASVAGEAAFAIDNLKIGTLNKGMFVDKYQIENEDGTKVETLTAENTYNLALSADFNKKNNDIRFIVGFYSENAEGKLLLNSASLTDLMPIYGGMTIENNCIATFTVPKNVDKVKVFAWNGGLEPIFPVCEVSVEK